MLGTTLQTDEITISTGHLYSLLPTWQENPNMNQSPATQIYRPLSDHLKSSGKYLVGSSDLIYIHTGIVRLRERVLRCGCPALKIYGTCFHLLPRDRRHSGFSPGRLRCIKPEKLISVNWSGIGRKSER